MNRIKEYFVKNKEFFIYIAIAIISIVIAIVSRIKIENSELPNSVKTMLLW